MGAGFYLDGREVLWTGGAFSPAEAVVLGRALGRMRPGGAVGIGSSGAPAFQALAAAAGAGAAEAGAAVWDVGDCFESLFFYCAGRLAADFGLYAGGAGVRVCSRGGLPLSLEEERRLSELLESPAIPAAYSGYGSVLPMGGIRELYPVALVKSAVCTLTGMKVSVKCADRSAGRLAEEALSRLGCRFSEGGLTLQLSGDGRDVSLYDKVSDYIFTDRILLLVCRDLFRRGQDAAVPASAPRVLDRMAEEWERRALRYEDGFESGSDRRARSLGVRQPFLRDGLMLGIRLLSILRESRCSLEELEGLLPEYAVVSRTVAAPRELLSGKRGLCLAAAGGEIRIAPTRGGRALFLAVEGSTAEAAGELCRFAEEELLNRRLPGTGKM